MEPSPDMKKLEEMMRSSRLVLGGFLGNDPRHIQEIIDADLAEIAGGNYTVRQIAARMQLLTDIGKVQLGGAVAFEGLEIRVVDYAGPITCPWSHPGNFDKRITDVKRIDTGVSTSWSDLNIHMISKHSFFEGRRSAFRLEPRQLIACIF